MLCFSWQSKEHFTKNITQDLPPPPTLSVLPLVPSFSITICKITPIKTTVIVISCFNCEKIICIYKQGGMYNVELFLPRYSTEGCCNVFLDILLSVGISILYRYVFCVSWRYSLGILCVHKNFPFQCAFLPFYRSACYISIVLFANNLSLCVKTEI